MLEFLHGDFFSFYGDVLKIDFSKYSQRDFPGGLLVKNPAASAGEAGSIPGSGRSPGERHGNPLQFSYLENPLDRGTWGATVHRVSRVEHNLSTKLQLVEFNLHVSLMAWPPRVSELESCFFFFFKSALSAFQTGIKMGCIQMIPQVKQISQ